MRWDAEKIGKANADIFAKSPRLAHLRSTDGTWGAPVLAVTIHRSLVANQLSSFRGDREIGKAIWKLGNKTNDNEPPCHFSKICEAYNWILKINYCMFENISFTDSHFVYAEFSSPFDCLATLQYNAHQLTSARFTPFVVSLLGACTLASSKASPSFTVRPPSALR